MLNEMSLDVLWRKARSHKGWLQQDIDEKLVTQLYDLLKMAPTATNCCPARFTFVKTDKAKQRLKKSLSEGNIEKSMSAPIVVIIAYDTEFYEKFPTLSSHTDVKRWREADPTSIKEIALMNATLQGAYLMLASRSVGLDCSPMAGFDNKILDDTFYADGKKKSIFICGLGYGNKSKLFNRAPRLDFSESCEVL